MTERERERERESVFTAKVVCKSGCFPECLCKCVCGDLMHVLQASVCLIDQLMVCVRCVVMSLNY